MFSLTIDVPILDRLDVDFARAVRKGGAETRKIIVERTKAGKDADGKSLPEPKGKAGMYGPVGRPLYRTGELVESIVVGRVRKLTVRVGPAGYHSRGKANRAISALERASGKKVSKAKADRIRRKAGAALKKRKGAGGKRGMKGGATPLPMLMYAQQAGAVGGRKAGYRTPFRVMDLSPREVAQVQERMRADVVKQIAEAEARGSVIAFHNVKKVLRGQR